MLIAMHDSLNAATRHQHTQICLYSLSSGVQSLLSTLQTLHVALKASEPLLTCSVVDRHRIWLLV